MSATSDKDETGTLSFDGTPTTPLLPKGENDEEELCGKDTSQGDASVHEQGIAEAEADDDADVDGESREKDRLRRRRGELETQGDDESASDADTPGMASAIDPTGDMSLMLRRVGSSFLIPFMDQTGSPGKIAVGLLCLVLVGSAIGSFMPKDDSLPTPWYRLVSSVVGYIYFLCWSVSFYPQVLLNYKRKSTAGLSNDFSVLNVLGFGCYATYTLSFFFSSAVRKMYKERNGEDAEITVQSNDVAFAVHALVLCVVQVLQIWYYGGFRVKALSLLVQLGVGGLLLVCSVFAVLILAGVGGLNWLDYLYMLSFVKVLISTVKYVPQVVLNIQRKSTVGWNIWNIILDFTGGMLSILQLIGDSADLKDWDGIAGNPAKFALGFVSIFFDLIFFLQHYVLYREDANDTQVHDLLDNSYDTETLI